MCWSPRGSAAPNSKIMSSADNFLLETFSLKRTINLLKNTAIEWSDDKAPQLGAALAYYTVFSLAPLLLLLMSIFSLWVHDKHDVQSMIKDQVAQFAGGSSASVVSDIVEATARKKSSGVLATIAGVVIALFGASCVFGQLQDSLNTIWGVKAKPGLGIMGYVQARFVSFAMVGGVCFMLLVSLTVTVAIKGMSDHLNKALPGAPVLTAILSIVVNLVVITALFAMIFKFLPDAKISWSDVWIGAALTTVLFIVGKWALGLYLGSGSAGSAYGAVGSLITTLIWVYYSAQIMLFGAEFTQVYANEFGSHIEPEPHAVLVEKKVVEIPTRSAT